MFSTSTTAVYILASLALGAPALADAIFKESDAKMTFYYDISSPSDQACGLTAGDPVSAGWAVDSGINGGVPYCERSRGYSLDKIGTNRIVAFNAALVSGDPAKWCGREVQVYNPDGSKFDFSEGSFYIWDGCAACESSNSQILDLSAPAFVEIKGGTCGGTNPTGLSYEVLDNYIVDPSVGLGSAYSAESGSGSSDESASPAASPTTTTAAAPSTTEKADSTSTKSASKANVTPTSTHSSSSSPTTTSVTLSAGGIKGAKLRLDTTSAEETETKTEVSMSAPQFVTSSSKSVSSSSKSVTSASSTETSSASGCTYGAWQCDGLTLQVCNYLTISSLGWETIATCNSVCEFTSSGSVDCE